ncbi:hypothetical protein ZWY2020_011980 [Hordeum vulgare]|nr:hypothetical protein ZWY2020_011980 [Hordeum vulgare]
MEQHSVIITKKLLELYHGFEGIGTLVDVAGGLGAVIHAITTKYPGIKGINFDRVNSPYGGNGDAELVIVATSDDHGGCKRTGRELVNGLMFLYTDEGCMKMSDHITDAGVADIYVEYNGEQDYADDEDSGSDFEEEELHDLVNNGSEGEPDVVITAEEEDVILVPNESGVVTEVIQSPVKHNVRTEDLSQCSQVVNSSQPVVASQSIPPIPEVVENGEDSEDSDDPDYVAHTDDSGEESEVVELRKHARKFKKKMKASEIWFAKESSGPVPIELVANVEEVVHDMEFQSSDEDYSYDEDEDGQMGHNKSSCKKNGDRTKKNKIKSWEKREKSERNRASRDYCIK